MSKTNLTKLKSNELTNLQLIQRLEIYGFNIKVFPHKETILDYFEVKKGVNWQLDTNVYFFILYGVYEKQTLATSNCISRELSDQVLTLALLKLLKEAQLLEKQKQKIKNIFNITTITFPCIK